MCSYVKLDYANIQQIMLQRSSKLEKPKLERAKLAFDNLESSKVRGTGVLRRSSAIAVELG